jgi:hypothetical protein
MFGRLPASAIYIRHARGIRITNTEFRAEQPEERNAIVSEDVHDLELRAVTASAPTPAEAAFALHDTTDVFIQGARITSQATSLVHVTGASSRHIVLSANDLSLVAVPTHLSNGATEQAITSL